MLSLFHGLTSFFSFRLGPAFFLYSILKIENNRKMIGRLQVGNVRRKVLFLFEQAEGRETWNTFRVKLTLRPLSLKI
jgi:hypothetical protein